MKWIKSGIENPSKSEIIGPCGGEEKTEPTKVERYKTKQTHGNKLLKQVGHRHILKALKLHHPIHHSLFCTYLKRCFVNSKVREVKLDVRFKAVLTPYQH